MDSEHLPDDPLLGGDPVNNLYSAKRNRHVFTTFGATALLSFLLGATISSVLWNLQFPHIDNITTHEPIVLNCGKTPEEARANGCKFQLWAFSWVPEPCYDGEIEEEYLQMRDWSFYMDREGKEEVEVSVAQSGEHVIWTTWGQHYWHCIFTTKKLVNAVAINGSGVGLTSSEIGPHVTHMDHCLDATIEKDKYVYDSIMEKIEPNYHFCYLATTGPHLNYGHEQIPPYDNLGRPIDT